MEETPSSKELIKKFKFNCPMCLCYMTHMLQSECCGNYLCHFCAYDMYEREKEVENYIPTCLFNCVTAKWLLIDVPVDANPKRYADS